MVEEFSLDAIPLLSGYVAGAMSEIHNDISKRSDIGGTRSVIIELKVDPDTLLLKPEVKTKLPKGDNSWKLKTVPMFRENGTLKVGETVTKQQTIFEGGE